MSNVLFIVAVFILLMMLSGCNQQAPAPLPESGGEIRAEFCINNGGSEEQCILDEMKKSLLENK